MKGWTEQESLHSLVEANVLSKNKYGDKEPESCGCMGPCGRECNYALWQAEEEQVFHNPFLMIEKK